MSRVPLLFERIGAKDDAFILYQREGGDRRNREKERWMADIVDRRRFVWISNRPV